MSHFDQPFEGNVENCSESVVICLRAVAQRLDQLQICLGQISASDPHQPFSFAAVQQQLQQDTLVLQQLADRAELSAAEQFHSTDKTDKTEQPDPPASPLVELLTQPPPDQSAPDRQSRVAAAMLRFRLDADRSIAYGQRLGDWEAIYGSMTAEANPADWLERILPADREAIVLPTLAALTRQTFLSVEYRFLHLDGRLRWLQAHFTSARDDQANCWQVTCIQTDITAQKQGEQHLAQLQERFTKVFCASPTAMCISRRTDGLLVEVNDRYLELVEYDRQELLGKTSIELGILPLQEQNFLLKLLQVQSERPIEWWYYTRSGKKRLARIAAEPIDLNGEPHLLILVEDVTDYRRVQSDLQQLNETLESIVQQRTQELQASQAALQTSQRQLEAILDNSPLVVYLLDRENHHLLVNHRYEELVGLSREQLIGAPLEAVWGSADGAMSDCSAGAAFEHIRQVWETGEAIETEEVLQVQGQQRIYLSSKFPLFDSQGRLYAVGGICLDITDRMCIEAERQRAEAILAQREREYRTLVENCPDVIIRIDRTGRYLYVSPSFSQLFGVSQEDCIGRTDLEIGFPPDLSARCSLALQRLFQQCEPQTLEFSIPTPAGPQFHQSRAVPEIDDRGNVISALIVGRDITQMKQAEQRLQQAVTELERVSRLKDEFLSTVSHELRTPVSNMKLSIRMLEVALQQAEIEPDDRMRQYLAILNRECGREISLINDLLDLQRLEANQDSIALESIDLKIWLSRLVEPFQERACNRQQRLRLDLPKAPLPHLFSDPSILDRILAELLNNACKYTPPGEQIVVRAAADSQSVLLSVQNSGTEIPTDELPRIFDKFYRVPSTDPWKQGGTGLGLALVQKLVEHLQGTIQVQSRSSNTTFTVILPIAQRPHS